MRNLVAVLLLIVACAGGSAQAARTFVVESEHYRVTAAASAAQAEEVGRRMESILALANEVFHFDLSALPARMQVRVLADEAALADFLTRTVGEARSDFVFLAYEDPSQSELLCFPREEPSFSASLIHQGVVQLSRTFVATLPVWLREGVAAALEAATWDPAARAYVPRPNLAWLDTLKAMVRGEASSSLIPLADLVALGRDAARARLDAFYPEAWGFVHFLMNSPVKAHNRILWDAISALRPEASAEENTRAVQRRAFAWTADDQLTREFSAWVLSQKNATDLAREGADAYARGDLAKAEASFTAALALEPLGVTALYYLGLIAYARKDFFAAEGWYQRALKAGAAASLINYALGVNAFAAGSYAPAGTFLKLAKDADPIGYGDKVDALLKRMEAQR